MIKHAYRNLLEDGVVTLSAGAAATGFPLYRLYDRNIGKLFKGSAAVTTTVKVDTGAPTELVVNGGFEAGAYFGWNISADNALTTTPALVSSGTYASTFSNPPSGLSFGLNQIYLIDERIIARLTLDYHVPILAASHTWMILYAFLTDPDAPITGGSSVLIVNAVTSGYSTLGVSFGPAGSGADYTWPAGTTHLRVFEAIAGTGGVVLAALDVISLTQRGAEALVSELIIPSGHNLASVMGPVYAPHDMYAIIGAVDSGTMDDLAVADGVEVVLSELALTPAFEYRFYFTVQSVPASVNFKGRYTGATSHLIYAEIYNFATSAWDRLTAATTDIPYSAVDMVMDWPIPGTPANYVSSGSQVHIRFYHASAGVVSHKLHIDMLTVGDGCGLILSSSDDDAVYQEVAHLIPSAGFLSLAFPARAARYWRISIPSPLVAVEIPELILTSTYEHPRNPARPSGPHDLTPTMEVVQLAGGQIRTVRLGGPRRRRVYRLEGVSSAHKAELEALEASWADGKPFWVCDHEGVWIYVQLTGPIRLIEQSYGRHSAVLECLEVLP